MSAINTYTGIIMDPIKPEEKLICIEDIAHALSLLCRANGHFKTFYSVAQHSINCMREAAARGYSKRLQLACLLHDGSEAYLADITRPVKAELPKYKEIEEPLQELIWNKWLNEPLTEQEKTQVFEIDDAILAHEFIELMNTQIVNPIPKILTKPEYAFAGFEKTEQEFLSAFRKLTSEERNTFAVGIDWMKPFWLAAEIHGDGLTLRKMKHISEISDYYLQANAVLIDIPIGLPETGEEAECRPDQEARKILPAKRKPSIFPVPCRQAIRMEDYTQANAENERVLGSKLTSQSYGFSKMIRQVDDFLAEDICWVNRLTESHPEVAFQMLNHGKGLQYSKHIEEGIQERVSILRSYGVDPGPLFADFKPKQYEDVLDAVCLAVSAKIGCENEFESIPENPMSDSRGLKMQMVFGQDCPDPSRELHIMF